MALLTVKHLSFSYPDAKEPALREIDFSIEEGEFAVICGSSGCGKSTLLRLLKPEIAPVGDRSGEILYCEMPQETLSPRMSASEIGMVMQDPEMQTVTDRVWHELAFGAENIGMPQDRMRLRVGETASYFGIENLFRRDTDTLSGGQKQLLSLAAVTVLSPRLLLLDEPTAQLDPIAASNLIDMLYRINREMGTTILLAEHRLEALLPIVDRLAVMENGRLVAFDTPRKICADKTIYPLLEAALPASVCIFNRLGGDAETDCPLSVREGRAYLASLPQPQAAEKPAASAAAEERFSKNENLLCMRDVFFSYERHAQDVLRGVSVTVRQGEIFTVLGGNGAGKSTLLRVIAGTCKPYRGRVSLLAQSADKKRESRKRQTTVALLPQDVSLLFVQKTVALELLDAAHAQGYTQAEAKERIDALVNRLEIAPFLDRHPYDLSGGEAQKCALAKVLLSAPRLLLLDEPTKGIDAFAKQTLITLLRDLQKEGTTIFLVTHDVEFAAAVADRCALLFDGELLAEAPPKRFFATTHFYTTAAARISRGSAISDAVTAAQICDAYLGGNHGKTE